jgi:hypothetical protein
MTITTGVDIAVERSPAIDMDIEQSRRFFDKKARSLLGIGGEEFLRRWRAGEYAEIADDPAHSDIMYLALLGTGGR